MSKRKAPQTAKTIGWDDETIKGGGFSEKPDIYKGRQGFTDIVRVLTLPKSFIICSVNPRGGGDGQGFSANCLAEHEDVLEGIIDGNDRDARKRAEDACPMLERGYPAKRRFVALIWHEARINPKGQRKKIQQVMPFVFDGGKYEHIRTIAQTLPPLKNGKRRPLHLVELQFTCTDNKFQKMNFSYSPTVSTKWSEVKEKAGEAFDDGWSQEGESSELIRALLEHDERQRLVQSIDRVEGKGSFAEEGGSDEFDEEGEDYDDEEEEAAPARRSKRSVSKTAKKTRKGAAKKNQRKKKPEPEEEDDEDEDIADELDEALEDADIEDYEEEDDEEED